MPSSSERTRRPGTPFTIIIPHAIRSGPLWPILPPASRSRWSPVTDWARPNVDNSRLLPDALTPTVQDLLGEAAGGGGARGRGRGLRPGPVEIFDLRGIQPRPAASVVGRAEPDEAGPFRSQQEIV